MQPPLLPEEVLSRALRLARFDGVGVLTMATFFAVSAGSLGDKEGAVIWLLVAGTGAMTLHGLGLIREYESRGLSWIIASQYLLIAIVLSQCALRLAHYDPSAMREALTDEMKASLAQANYDQEEFLHTVYVTTYGVIAGVVSAYKLGLAVYFHRRRRPIESALDAVE